MMADKQQQKLLVQNNPSLQLEMIEFWLWLLIMLLNDSLVMMKEIGNHFILQSEYSSDLIIPFVLSCKLVTLDCIGNAGKLLCRSDNASVSIVYHQRVKQQSRYISSITLLVITFLFITEKK
jgi:hypothetical protein